MKYLILALLFASGSSVFAQSFTLAGPSFSLVSETPGFTEVSIAKKGFGAHIFFDSNRYPKGKNPLISQRKHFFALSKSFNFKFLSFGPMLFSHSFPDRRSSNFNFFVSAGIDVSFLRISIKHISNGFGVLHKHNPGLDMLSFTLTPY